jgi:hypothetical protein
MGSDKPKDEKRQSLSLVINSFTKEEKQEAFPKTEVLGKLPFCGRHA